MIADDLRTYVQIASRVETSKDWEARAQVSRDPGVLVGGSDAGAHLDMLATLDYPTKLLANFVREHHVMSLEETVHLITGAPASFYGIRDRGFLDESKAGDIVIFDPDSIGATPWASRSDLPGQASRIYSEGIGIDHVLVNGEEIVDHGTFTEARPGALLRSGIDTQTPSLFD